MVRNLLSLAFRMPDFDRLQPNLLETPNRRNGRFAERRRIARDLHDTALQSLLTAFLKLDFAMDQIPKNSPAKMPFGSGLELMRRGIEEIQKAVQGLRSPETENNDLVQALRMIPRELDTESRFDFHFLLLGRARQLNSLVGGEVYRIGREALTNAFRHSGASRIEIELEFANRRLRLSVRDNGCGMRRREAIAAEHYGFVGMHERAKQIGAKLKVWSKPGAGTEIELSVPNSIAFKRDAEDPNRSRPEQ